MYQSLADAIRSAEAAAAVRVILIDSAGDAFTAGNDLQDFLSDPPRGQASPVFQFLTAISTAAKPIVAAVHGAAVGLGTTMLLHCDLVYAAENTALCVAVREFGPYTGGRIDSPLAAPSRLSARPPSCLLLGEPFDVSKACDAGLVTAVVSKGFCVRSRAGGSAKARRAAPPTRLRLTKQLMRRWDRELMQRAMKEEGDTFISLLDSPEAKEAFAAFLEKRKPDFTKFA